MRYGLQYTFHPTPEMFRNAGDTLLGTLGVTGVSTILSNHTTAGLIITGVGLFLKTLSNFVTHS